MARLRQAYEHLGHCKLESGQREAKVLSFETIGQEERFSGKQLTSSSSHYQLHSGLREKSTEAEVAYLRSKYKDMSQDLYCMGSMARKYPRQYVPLAKQSAPEMKPTSSSKGLEQRKQLQYKQSQEYQRYLQEIFRNSNSSKEIARNIKSIRSNNIYLASNSQASEMAERSKPGLGSQERQPSRTYSNSIAHSLSNLSKITEKNMILIHDPDQEMGLNCQPYLQNSSIIEHHHRELQQQRGTQCKPERNTSSNIPKSYRQIEGAPPIRRFEQQNVKTVSKTKQKHQNQSDALKQTQLNIKPTESNKGTNKIEKRYDYPPPSPPKSESRTVTLKDQSTSIYNLDFKLDRPSKVAHSFTHCVLALNLSHDKSPAHSKSNSKIKMSVITTSGRRIR